MISQAEFERRRDDARQIHASTALEGRSGTPAARVIQDLYVIGLIDADELLRRTHQLFGHTPPEPTTTPRHTSRSDTHLAK